MLKKYFSPDFLKTQSVEIITPRGLVHGNAMTIIVIFQLSYFILSWITSDFPFLPSPIQILSSYQRLFINYNLNAEMLLSFRLCLEASFYSLFISCFLAYLSEIPFFRFIKIISKLRFNSLVGISFFFGLLIPTNHFIKLSMLIFGMSVFLLDGLLSMIKDITDIEYDHASTLKLSRWEILWHVVIRGKLHKVWDLFRQNFAIAWMMLTMVENVAKSEGGVGILLEQRKKYMAFDDVIAIQLLILAIGLLVDYGFKSLKYTVLPYSRYVK